MDFPLLSLAATALFAAVHLIAPRLRFLSVIPRSRWLSAAGGISVAYVFLHLLPEIAGGREHLEDRLDLERAIWLLALAGLTVFYGLERRVRALKRRHGDARPVFWLHMASFGVYNLLIGYLTVHREDSGLTALIFYAVAIALHFLTNDFGLRHDHAEVYDRQGRFVLAGAVLAGALLGLLVELSEPAIVAAIAFLGGSIVLNVLKEELPEERESRFGAFLAGAGGYAVLLILAG